MQLLSPRCRALPTVASGLSLCGPLAGQEKGEGRDSLPALPSATHVGAQVAPQRCPIFRMSASIVHRFPILNHSQRRPTDIFNPDQGTFWNPDSRTFYFLVDKSWLLCETAARQSHDSTQRRAIRSSCRTRSQNARQRYSSCNYSPGRVKQR